MATSQDFVNWVCSEALDPRFLMYALMAEGDHILTFGKGTTHTTIYFPEVLAFQLCLAPLDEQRRIVEKVEMLLAHVSVVRQRLARVPVILKRFRQSVLAAACSGRLTEDWRRDAVRRTELTSPDDERGLPRTPSRRRAGRLWGAGEVPDLTEEERASVPESWEWTKVRDLGAGADETVQIGPMSMKSSEFTDNGVPVLNVGCVQSGWIDDTKCDHLPPRIAAAFKRYRIRSDDVLFTRSGTVGRCAVASEAHNGCVITFHLLRVRPDQQVCRSRYLWMALTGMPSVLRQAAGGQIGSTRGGFNTRLLASLDVPLPPIDEQDEIIRRTDQLLGLADAVKRHVAVATARADRLTQGILVKAVRGELVPTEVELARVEGRDYESAEQLLQRVHAELQISAEQRTPERRQRKTLKSSRQSGRRRGRPKRVA